MSEQTSENPCSTDTSTRDLVKDTAWKMLAAGQKPSVNSVRALIGRGSATTIQSALNGWWQEVGKRITGAQSRPDVPDSVLAAANNVWAAAIKEAQSMFDAERASFAAKVSLLEAQAERDASIKKSLANQSGVSEKRIEALKDQARDLKAQVDRLEQAFRDKAIEHERKLREQAEDHNERLEAIQLLSDAQDKRRKAEVDDARKEARDAVKRVYALETEIALLKAG